MIDPALRALCKAFAASGRILIGACVALLACATASPAQEIAITDVQHFTEHRGWGEAGLSPTYQIVVSANVVPSGYPTLAFAEQGGVRQPLSHFANPAAPNVYAHWQAFKPGLTGSWRIVAERGEARGAPATTRAIVRPQEVPLVGNVRVEGKGLQPRVAWELPDLAAFDVDRIRVAVRGAKLIHDRFMAVLYVSGDLSPNATAFMIPPDVLASGARYIFQVMLEDLEDGALENRSLTFSEPYTVSP